MWECFWIFVHVPGTDWTYMHCLQFFRTVRLRHDFVVFVYVLSSGQNVHNPNSQCLWNIMVKKHAWTMEICINIFWFAASKKMQYPEPEFIVNKTWHILGRWSCKALDIFVLVDKFTCFVTNAPNIRKRTSVALLNEYPCSSICSYCGSWTCNETRILLDLCRTVFIHWFVDKFAHWFIDS